MTRDESIAILNNCIKQLQNATPEEKERMRKIYNEEMKKPYYVDDSFRVILSTDYKKGDVNMENDLIASKDYEIAKLQEKIIAITKEKEELKKEISQLNSDIIGANSWTETLQSKVEFYENIFKKIKTIEFKG